MHKPGPNGCAPDRAPTVLILLDLINGFDFPEGEELYRRALPMADRLAQLKARCREHGIPSIYVNDHFGRWRSDFSALVEESQQEGFRGRAILEKLKPADDDYFVFKPMHSGFYQTTLELLLRHLGARKLIITGLASNICVLFTANDAHMRGYELWVPQDCMAAATEKEQEYAVFHLGQVMSADVREAAGLSLKELAER